MNVVYVVSNGTGGQIDSSWSYRESAQMRANALNRPGGEMLEWSVSEIPFDHVPTP